MTPLQQATQAEIEVTQVRWEGDKLLATPKFLPQQSVEPVAWAMRRADGLVLDIICPDEHESHEGDYTIPLYLHPPQQAKQVPMTDDAIEDIWLIAREANDFPEVFARAIEAHHGIWQVDKDCLTTGGQP